MKTMNDLFLHFLQDIYYAEKAFAKSSARIMKAAQNEEVRKILKKATFTRIEQTAPHSVALRPGLRQLVAAAPA